MRLKALSLAVVITLLLSCNFAGAAMISQAVSSTSDLLFTPANNVKVDAVTFGSGTTLQTFNGVAFDASNPNIAVVHSASDYGASGPNLNGLLGGGFYSEGTPVIITVSNLTPGMSYQVDLLTGNNGDNRTELVTVNNEAPVSFALAANGTYDMNDTVAADINGQITVTIAPTSGSGNDPSFYPLASAIAVTTTPEPATMALLTLGGIGALLRRRK